MAIHYTHWKQRADYASSVCGGGVSRGVLAAYAANVHPVLTKTANVLTCTSPQGAKPCSSGCSPYVSSQCPNPSGSLVNPFGFSFFSDVCSDPPLREDACSVRPTSNDDLDADSKWVTDSSKLWRPVLSNVDPAFSGAFATTGLPSGDLSKSRDIVPKSGWSNAAVKSVQRYLMTRGPMLVSIGVYEFFSEFYSKSAGNSKKPYSGLCEDETNHVVVLLGWKMLANATGHIVPVWIVRNSYGSAWGDGGDFYVPIDTASRDFVRGCLSMQVPVGISFSPSRLRGLSDSDLHSATQRHLQELIANPPKPSGAVFTCISNLAAVTSAGIVAKSQMDAALGVAYTGFVVHALECQVTGSGMIYKAAVSAENPVTGSRDKAHITFLKEHVALDPIDDPTINADAPIATDSDFALPANSAIGLRQLAAGAHRALSSAADASAPTVLDFALTPSTPAAADTSFSKAVTNPSALEDPLVQILGIRSSAALVITAIIIVGCFLFAVITYVMHYTWSHYHIMSHLRTHWPTLHLSLPHLHLHMPHLSKDHVVTVHDAPAQLPAGTAAPNTVTLQDTATPPQSDIGAVPSTKSDLVAA
jgi:hypothetical protein